MISDNKYDWHVAIWWAVQRGRSDESELELRIALDLRDAYLVATDAYWDRELEGFKPLGMLNNPFDKPFDEEVQ